jgi:hypothetical protein
MGMALSSTNPAKGEEYVKYEVGIPHNVVYQPRIGLLCKHRLYSNLAFITQFYSK